MPLRPLLEEAMERGASDLHLTVGEYPKIRIDGWMVRCSHGEVLSSADTMAFTYSILTENQKKRFEAEHELDFSFAVPDLARFRANAYRQRGSVALAIRLVPARIPPLGELGLPSVVSRLAERSRGLVLVTGPTGSGKSTTLAAMIDKINRERRGHILTIEDPIEFIHPHHGCMVNQREVGSDTRSFAHALKYALRQDPDVILIGEIRDLETVQAALTIAETGHLCLASLHTHTAPESVNRIIDVFPVHQQSQVRAQLATVLEGVVTQTLVPHARGTGRIVAAEVMVCTPAIRACIRDDKIHQIYSMMQTGRKHGMQTLNDSLRELSVKNKATMEDCLKVSPDPDELMKMADHPAPIQW